MQRMFVVSVVIGSNCRAVDLVKIT
jgi:hypothetical protein